MAGLQVTELNAFSGGMNNVTAPYLIAKDESTLLINVDLRRGAMWSMPREIKHSDIMQAYFYQYKRVVYTYGSWRSNVLWDNKWYWSDGAYTGKMLPDGTEYELGLPTPALTPTAIPDTAEGPHTGDFKYTYTFYNEDTGVESAPSALSKYAIATENNIVLDNFDALPVDATSYRVYRIGGFLPYFTMVINTKTLPYTDNLDDTQIDGRQLQTLRNGPPPHGIHYFTELGGRLYGAVGNMLYYSAIGNPDSWYIYDYIPSQDTIMGLAKVPGGLLIMGETWTNILKGNSPLNFNLKVVSDKVGMVNCSSLAYIDQNAVWLASHGVVLSDGYSIQQLTADRIEDIQGIRPTGAATLNNVYFMAYKPQLFPSDGLLPSPSLYPNAVKGTGGVDQGILTLDFKRGNGFSYRILDFYEVTYLSSLDGEIAIINGNSIDSGFPVCDDIGFPNCDDWMPCSGFELAYINKFDPSMLEQLDHLADIDYISPLMVDGTTVTLKEYDKVRVVYKGVFKITVMFDNDRVILERTIQSRAEWTYDYAMLGIPNDDNKAYSIRVRVEGRGVVKGIQYTYKMRELP